MLDGCTPWPEAVARRYREAGAWRGESLAGLLDGPLARRPGHTAIVHERRRIGYAELDGRAARLAAGFAARGLAAGDRVVVQLPNVPELVEVALALFRIGAAPVLTLPDHRAAEIGEITRQSGAVALVVSGRAGYDAVGLGRDLLRDAGHLRTVYAAHAGDLDAPDGTGSTGGGQVVALESVDAEPSARPAPDASEVAFFLLSGGTTALPKLIPRTHDDYLCQLRATTDVLGLGPDDVYLATLPAAFNFAWGCPGVLGTLRAGGTVVLSEDPEPLGALRTAEAERVSVVSLVPTLAELWTEEQAVDPLDLSALRVLQIGGARLHPAAAERVLDAFGPCLQQVFGMSEGLLAMTRPDDPREVVVGTQGRPVSGLDEIRIVDDDGTEVPDGTYGELETRGPYTLRGYYRAPEHNAVAFAPDGFYRTGDAALRRPDGNLEIAGRRRDVINRGGMKVSSSEVEGHLLAHDDVTSVAVVPVADDLLGQRVCVCLGPGNADVSLAELRRHCRARGLAGYKLPEHLERVDAMPLTRLGKIDKASLERLVAERAAAGPNDSPDPNGSAGPNSSAGPNDSAAPNGSAGPNSEENP